MRQRVSGGRASDTVSGVVIMMGAGRQGSGRLLCATCFRQSLFMERENPGQKGMTPTAAAATAAVVIAQKEPRNRHCWHRVQNGTQMAFQPRVQASNVDRNQGVSQTKFTTIPK